MDCRDLTISCFAEPPCLPVPTRNALPRRILGIGGAPLFGRYFSETTVSSDIFAGSGFGSVRSTAGMV